MDVGSSSFLLSDSLDSSDSLQGLKFGKKIYFEDVLNGSTGSSATMSVTAADATFTSARKGKSQGAVQPPRCQVEGCMVDLSDAKPYYSRHKVCGMHSKSPKVVVAGLEKRFCQQCSRFHQLPEFDQGKRSCRRKLAGHNERRRKPPVPSLLSRTGHLFPSFHGGSNGRPSSSILDFSYPKLLSTYAKGWPTTNFGHGGDGRPAGHQWQGGGGFNNISLPPGGCPARAFSLSAEVPQYITEASESSCALSLLSSQPCGTTIPARTHASFNHRPQMPQPAMPSNYVAANSWSFKERGGDAGYSGSSNAVQNEMEYDRMQFSGELELALQGSRHGMELDPSRGFGTPDDSIHWSL